MKQSSRVIPRQTVNPFHETCRENDNLSWVLSLSDLMSLLLIFFLVWTTLKIASLKRTESAPDVAASRMSFVAPGNPLEGLKDTLMEFSPVKTPDGNIIIVLEEDISFDSDSAVLSAKGKRILKRIAQKLKTGTHYRVRIIGHTDSLPVSGGSPWISNFDLSIHRAAAAASRLIYDGIPAGRITCQGLGSLYPARNDDSPQKRRFNRRVELIIEPA